MRIHRLSSRSALTPPGENGGPGPAVVTAILCTVLSAGRFGVLARRGRPTQRAAGVLGVVAVLSLPVFWSGITPVLAAANLAVTSGSEGLGKAAATTRILAVIAALAAIAVTAAGSHVF